MACLLALTVGPVQEFIAAARRTRDLWFGSYLLSEVSKATAKAVRNAGSALIFPAPRGDTDLDPDSELNVANVLLAELPAGADPKYIAERARGAAQACWKQFAEGARHDAPQVIRHDVWDEQVGDVIEFAAAWCPFTRETYRNDRARVMRLLAGRKNCRDFAPAGRRPGLPKSSLDGLRDTVLNERKDWPNRARARLRVREGEQLDVVGLTKRVAEGTRRYPSVSRVAADPWLRGHAGRLDSVIEECRRLNGRPGPQVVRELNVAADGHPHFAGFPFEGTAVFASRHHELEEEAELDESMLQPLARAVAKVGSEPHPYLAVLVADGDRMGATIAELLSPDEHRRFSSQLAAFAGEAKAIVHDPKYSGVLIYAGGDDVLAFLPVDTCLRCARELHDRFAAILNPFVDELNAGREVKLKHPTLSVGVAIGHFMENLEDLLQCGRAAEKHAKKLVDPDGTKDALAVHLYKRGGSTIEFRAKWDTNPDQRILTNAGLFLAKALPSRLAYDLHRMADVYDNWLGTTDEARKKATNEDKKQLREAIRRDVLRLVAAKVGDRAKLKALASELSSRVTDADSLLAFATELLVARQVAVALRQAGGNRSGGAP